MTSSSDGEWLFAYQWRLAFPSPWDQPRPEYKFRTSRKWRFDFAWPDSLVAVEIEGGAFSRGRHTRPLGFRADCEKYNAAAADGWKVFRFTPEMIKDDAAAVLQMIRTAIDSTGRGR